MPSPASRRHLRAKRAPGRSTGVSLNDFERECVGFFADLVQVLGVPRSVGQIFGLLFASPHPLSFTDIAARLDISRGSASQGLQSLRTLGAVRRTVNSLDRRELFVPELGLRKLFAGVIREKIDPLLSDDDSRLQRLRGLALAGSGAPNARFYLQQVRQIDRWRRQISLLLPMFRTIFRVPRA